MKSTYSILLFLLFVANIFLSSCEQKQEQPNILLLCIDDLRPELASFDADYIHSPNIDALAEKGFRFRNHYVNAPSCGPSRYTLLTGTYGSAGNDALFLRAKAMEKGKAFPPSMPQWFRNNGYTTVSVGKVSHHPGGRGGADWNDTLQIEVPKAWDRHLMPVAEWQHPRGAMHGLAHGEIRVNPSEMDLFQSSEGDNNIYPDGSIAQEGMKQLEMLSKKDKPFFLAIGLIKPHLPFGAPKKYYDLYENAALPPIAHPQKPEGKTTWHGSGEFMRYNRWGKDPRNDEQFADEVRRHYAACVSYADDHVGQIIQKLKETGADKNTIIVLWGDHGWHLGEHAIWGKHSLFEEALHSPLIVYYPGIEKAGKSSKSIVETVDIFPTLVELTGISKPDFTVGESLISIVNNGNREKASAIAYRNNATTIRTEKYRMTYYKDGYAELYDEESKEKETKNIAEQHPEVVKELIKQLRRRKE